MTSPQPIRFLPGRLVGRKRFRVISLLGRGAMGEVYRADDLELGERVALKFLPRARERDEEWRRRFRQEIRTARKVAHPNVCRVYDLDQHGGPMFLTMEYIAGEDLSQLIRRFGRDAEGNPTVPLPVHKALGLARQLCDGLAAIHDHGIYHRDLKPSNVIVDDQGMAKITDFGLAGWVGQDLRADEGTVPYMAPEQLDNREVTERSDLYALGLVLYELFTGRRAFAGSSRDGLRPPACVARGLDPAIDVAIMSCLKHDPEERPASARELAEALPEPEPVLDDDPTPFPPPEVLLVPEAGDRLSARAAWSVLGALAAGLALVTALAGATHLPRFLRGSAEPAVLIARAQETLSELGHRERPEYAIHGFAYEPVRLAALEGPGLPLGLSGESAAGPLSPITFWYRESPAPLTPLHRSAFASYDDPPLRVPGSLGIQLDPSGRLRRLDALATAPENGAAPAADPEWAPVIAAAGLDASALDAARPSVAPLFFADRRAAWEGALSVVPGGPPGRLEAAAFNGTPVSVRLLGPGTAQAPARRPPVEGFALRLSQVVLALWFLFSLLGAVCYARRNFRRKSADRGAALRLAAWVVCARMAVWLIGGDLLMAREGLEVFWAHFAEAAFFGGIAWILYVALEPLLRRDWPRRTASWVRLMHGRFGDPLLARDVLFGTAAGVGALLLGQLCLLVPAWLGGRPPDPADLAPMLLVKQTLLDLQLEALRGVPHALAAAIYAQLEAMLLALFGIFGLFLLWLLVKRVWIAVAAAAILSWVLMFNLDTSLALSGVVAAALSCALWLTVLLRLGFLPAVLAVAVAAMLGTVPLTPDLTAWYAPGGLVVLLVVLGLGVYGLVGSLGGWPRLPYGLGARRVS